jgi:mRNA interferase RelE/StbE
MKVEFAPIFLRDLKNIKDRTLLNRIRSAIQKIESVANLQQLPSVTKMHGADDYYRMRLGDWRIGFKSDGTNVVFLRCLNRKEIYRYFP